MVWVARLRLLLRRILFVARVLNNKVGTHNLIGIALVVIAFAVLISKVLVNYLDNNYVHFSATEELWHQQVVRGRNTFVHPEDMNFPDPADTTYRVVKDNFRTFARRYTVAELQNRYGNMDFVYTFANGSVLNHVYRRLILRSCEGGLFGAESRFYDLQTNENAGSDLVRDVNTRKRRRVMATAIQTALHARRSTGQPTDKYVQVHVNTANRHFAVSFPLSRTLSESIVAAYFNATEPPLDEQSLTATPTAQPPSTSAGAPDNKRNLGEDEHTGYVLSRKSCRAILADLIRISESLPHCTYRGKLNRPKTNADLLDGVRHIRTLTVDNRDRESDELRYSMRSFEQHTPWHSGRLLLVSPGHYPSWLDHSKNFLANVCVDNLSELKRKTRRLLRLPMEEAAATNAQAAQRAVPLCFSSVSERRRHVRTRGERYQYQTSVQKFAPPDPTEDIESLEDGEGLVPDSMQDSPYDPTPVRNLNPILLTSGSLTHYHHRRLIVVHQDSIIPYGLRVTINSFTIEQYLYRVRNMTSIHLYINDDYFLNRQLSIRHLVNEYGGTYVLGDNYLKTAVRAPEGSVDWRAGVHHTHLFVVKGTEIDSEDYIPNGLEEMWEQEDRLTRGALLSDAVPPSFINVSTSTSSNMNWVISPENFALLADSEFDNDYATFRPEESAEKPKVSSVKPTPGQSPTSAGKRLPQLALPKTSDTILIARGGRYRHRGVDAKQPSRGRGNSVGHPLYSSESSQLDDSNVAGVARGVWQAEDYAPEPLPDSAVPKHYRRFAMHAPFAYCTRMFEYLHVRFERELAANALWHRRRASQDLHPPYLYADFVLNRPWESSPKFLPYLIKLRQYREDVARLQSGNPATSGAGGRARLFRRRRHDSGNDHSRGGRDDDIHATTTTPVPPPRTYVFLDNEDACGPATQVNGPATKSRFVKFIDDIDANFGRIIGIENKNPIFFNINTDFSWENVSVQLQTYIAAKFPFPSYLEMPWSSRFELSRSPFLHRVRRHRKVRIPLNVLNYTMPGVNGIEDPAIAISVTLPPLNTTLSLIGSNSFNSLFSQLMSLPLILISNDAEGFCPLVRSLQMALPRYAGRDVVLVMVPPAHGRPLASVRAEQRHPIRHFMPVSLCTFNRDLVREVTAPANSSLGDAMGIGLGSVRHDVPSVVLQRATQAAVRTHHIRTLVIDARTAAAGDMRAWDGYEAMTESLAIPGQLLALDDFTEVPLDASVTYPVMNTEDSDGNSIPLKLQRGDMALVLQLSDAAAKSVHWVLGDSENDLLSAHPLPVKNLENMTARVRFSYDVRDLTV